MSETKSRIYGVASADEEPITDPAVYRDAFEKIDKEVFVRQAMAATATPDVPAGPAAQTVTPTSPSANQATSNSYERRLDSQH